MPRNKKTLYDYGKEGIKEHPELFEALLEFERTGKLKKPNPKTRANFTIDSNVLKQFRKYCQDKGFKMSALIEKFIKRTLEN
ncbi:hypothetical protein J4414_02530 [Candidatus Woesearchaeota archaeon]|nr:hypothetical protein [Candidatus Woesearchaeota archaeon]